MSILFANFAESTLAGPLADTDLSLAVQDDEASRFPSPTGSDYFNATIFDGNPDNLPEIVKVTARSNGTLTIVRAQESTSARSWNSGAKIRLAPTAAFLTAVAGVADYSGIANGSILAKNATTGAIMATPGVTTNNTNTLLNDSLVLIVDNSDTTKKAQFQASGISAATTRTITFPDLDGTMALMGVTNVGVFTANSFVPTSSTAPTNGIYLSAANTVGIAANSTLIAQFSSSVITFGTTTISTLVKGPDTTADVGMDTTSGMWGGGRGFYVEAAILAGPPGAAGIFDYASALRISTATGVSINFYTNGGGTTQQFAITHTASATNFFSVTGSNGGAPVLSTNAGGLVIRAAGNNTINFQVNGANGFAISQSGSAPDSYLQVSGNTTTNDPSLSVLSTQTNIGIRYVTKGTGPHKFWTNGGTEQVHILHTASATRYVTLTGSNGNAPTISTSAGPLATGTGRVVATRVVTAAGDVTVAVTDDVVIVNKSAGAATAANLPASPITGQRFTIKDGKGDANSNNITVTPAAGNIDGIGSYVINTNYGVVSLVYNGTEWSVV